MNDKTVSYKKKGDVLERTFEIKLRYIPNSFERYSFEPKIISLEHFLEVDWIMGVSSCTLHFSYCTL